MGADVRVDFRLVSEDTVRVRGKVTAISEEGAPVAIKGSFGVRLTERRMNTDVDAVLSATSATVWPDGQFEIRGVTPGSYLLSAAGPPGQRAALMVDIGSQHIDNLEVRLGRGWDLSGSVGPAGSAAVRVTLEPLDVSGGLFPRPSATADANGKLTFTQVFPVRYWVDVAGIPENGYLRSVTLGGRDLTEEPLDLSNGVSGTLRVVLGPSARLEGEVPEQAGQPRAGVTVALIPVSGRPLLYKSTTTDTKGSLV
jgi:hypothetical protein